jgi:hypothetical protein
MATLTADRLYALLPAIHRLRDHEQGEPLRALLAAFATQFAALEENLEQLYDDQFIETCAETLVPYLGDLIGWRELHGEVPRIASPRAEVTHTIAFRRRKGTALMLEELAQDVTGWPAHAVECFERLATTQYMKHPRLHAPASVPVRGAGALLRLGGAFETVTHTAEMRRPETGSGRYNIPNVAIFAWRLLAQRLSQVPLTPEPGDASGRRFRLNPLGADLRLFRRAITEDSLDQLAEPVNVPEPLTVRGLALAVRQGTGADDYGVGRSVQLWRPGTPPTPVPLSQVRICDLRDTPTGWAHEAAVPAGSIGLDPERGRVLLGAPGDGPLLATFHHGQPSAIGGGEYARTPEGQTLAPQRSAQAGEALQPHLEAIAAGGRLVIGDSQAYGQTPVFKVDAVLTPDTAGHAVVVAAADGTRPVVLAGGDINLAIGARGRLVIDGLVFAGGPLRLLATADDEPRELVLRDCTLVPGVSLQPDGTAVSPGAPSLVIEHPFAKVTLERCITGPLHAVPDADLMLQDCLVDAGDAATPAIAADAAGAPGAALTLRASTVVGRVHVRHLPLAEDSLFLGSLQAERRQAGCVRFCFVPTGSVTPRRFRCLPDEAHPDVLPHFTSLRYGDPGYGQLRHATDAAIRDGAHDGGEMGVLHALYQPQREANLRLRLDEYLRFGLHAGLFFAT